MKLSPPPPKPPRILPVLIIAGCVLAADAYLIFINLREAHGSILAGDDKSLAIQCGAIGLMWMSALAVFVRSARLAIEYRKTMRLYRECMELREQLQREIDRRQHGNRDRTD